jgi:hypothetical protein
MQFWESYNVETHSIRQDKVSLTENRAAAHSSCNDQYGCVIIYANCNSHVRDKTQTRSICPIISISEDHQYSVTM